MATHDYNIANQTALNFRGDLNDALEAIVTTNSNATAPTTTYAHMFWYDTSTDILKMRDETNSSWISVGYVDQSNLQFLPFVGGTQVTGFLDEDDLSSDSATAIPSQQSVKSYVDNNAVPLTFGEVGTYCLAFVNSTNVSSSLSRGSTVAGSSLMPASLSFLDSNQTTSATVKVSPTTVYLGRGSSSSTLSGTWRLMGEMQTSSSGNDYPVSLYLRIA